MDSKISPRQTVMAIKVLWELLVGIPMWLMLIFGILTSLDDKAPTWLWLLFLVYVPTQVFAGLVFGFIKVAQADEGVD